MNHMAGDFDDCQKEKRKIGNDGPSSVYLYTQGSAGSVPWCRTWWVDGWVVLSLRENPQNPRETQSRAVSKWIDIHPDIAEWEEDFSFSFHFFVVGLLFFFCFPPPLVSWKEHHHVPRCVHINAERVRLTENVQAESYVHTDEDFQSCVSCLDAVCTVQSTQSLHSATAAAAAGINSTRSFFPVYTSPTCLPVQCNRSYFEFAHCYWVLAALLPITIRLGNDGWCHNTGMSWISHFRWLLISLYKSSECLFWGGGGVELSIEYLNCEDLFIFKFYTQLSQQQRQLFIIDNLTSANNPPRFL